MDIALILFKKYANQQWTFNGSDYSGLTWLSDTPKPTEKEITDQWEVVQLEVVAEAEAKTAAKESALAKLAALGLTEDEIAAL
jgi:hypothetical protein